MATDRSSGSTWAMRRSPHASLVANGVVSRRPRGSTNAIVRDYPVSRQAGPPVVRLKDVLRCSARQNRVPLHLLVAIAIVRRRSLEDRKQSPAVCALAARRRTAALSGEQVPMLSARVAAWRPLGRVGRGRRASGPPRERVLELG